MPELEMQLKRIQEKLLVILKEQTVLKKETERLEKELTKCREQSLSQMQLIDTLRQHTEVLQLSSGEMNETDKKEMEKRINSYIKEIDRCITILGE